MTINIQQFRDALATVANEFQGRSRPFETRQAVYDMLYIGDGKGVLITKFRGAQLIGLNRTHIAQGFRAMFAEIPAGSRIVTCLPMVSKYATEYAHFIDNATGLIFEIQLFTGYQQRTITQITLTWGIET